MTQFLLAVSKYGFTGIIILFTMLQISGFNTKSERTKKFLTNTQFFLIVVYHLSGNLLLYFMNQKYDYLLFYAFQVLVFFAFVVFQKLLYPDINAFLVQDMLFLFITGLIILTRISFTKSVKQFIIAAVTMVVALFLPVIIKKFHFLSGLSGFYGVLGLGLLAVVWLFGAMTHGSKISYTVFGFTFQPSELVKILFAFFLASMLQKSKPFYRIVIAAVVAFAHVMILVFSKDLGSGMIFFIVFICVLFAGTRNFGYLLLGIGASGGAAVVAFKLFSHVQNRFIAWQDPWTKIDKEGYQIAQSLFAICSGKWFGLGLNQGSPKSIPYVEADFVFSAIAQEFGVVFGIALIVLYLVLFLTILSMSSKIQNRFYRLLGVGLGVTIIFQAFLTIGGGVKFIPSTGVTLPLISYGGTSVMSTILIFGILFGISLVAEEEKYEGKPYGEAFDEEQDLFLDGYKAGTKNAIFEQYETVLLGEDGRLYGFNYDDYGYAYDAMGNIFSQNGRPCDENGRTLSPKMAPELYRMPSTRAFLNYKAGRLAPQQPQVVNPTPKKKKRMGNYECAILMVSYSVLFLVMSGFIVNYVRNHDNDLVSNDYNPVQAIYMKQNYRGSIFDRNGNELAYTELDSEGKEQRVYPYEDLFCHVVGYSTKGKSGIEKMANSYLIQSHSSLNTKMEAEMNEEKNPGDDVYTTLDCRLQEVAKNALGMYKGAVVVTEVSTGEILCMYSNPGFDPNVIDQEWDTLSNDKESTVLLNRATQGLYPPGSTFKICTSLEYIKEHQSSVEGYYYQCNGTFSNASGTIHCYHNSAHGGEDFEKSFAKSCNSSFANIGLSVNRDQFRDTLQTLMFDEPIPMDLPFSKSHVVMGNEVDEYECMQTSIGQGTTLITPIHLNMITCSIANNGTLMKPYLVTDVKNHAGERIQTFSPQSYKSLMKPEEASVLKELMTAVVEDGTGKKLQNDLYTAAGKTGSAEYNSIKTDSHAWFTGFAPVDYPEIAVTVIVEGAGSGGEFAVPISKRIFDAYFDYTTQ